MNARSTAIANENASIDASQQRAIAARQAEDRRPRTAIEAMASRLQVTPEVLQNTLRRTAFSTCKTNEEFVSMVIVANEYGLNPLLKEMYAFPAKGGGIVPMVAVDGWIRLMNEHPMFDGIEFLYINDDKGNIEAIEAVIFRKDRSHPIKVIEYLEECRRQTEPWKAMPRRMLRNRTLTQAVRIAFGFSGISAEGDDDVIDGGTLQTQPVTLPSRQSLAEELDDGIPDFDKETGEITDDEPRTDSRGMTEVDEKTARELDSQQPNDGTLSDDNPDAGEGPADEQRGEAENQSEAAEQTRKDIDGPLDDDETPAWKSRVDDVHSALDKAGTKAAVDKAEGDFLKISGGLPDDVVSELEGKIRETRKAVMAKKEG